MFHNEQRWDTRIKPDSVTHFKLRWAGRNDVENAQVKEVFPGGSVAKTLCSQCRGPRFDPCSGNYILPAATKDPSYHRPQHSQKIILKKKKKMPGEGGIYFIPTLKSFFSTLLKVKWISWILQMLYSQVYKAEGQDLQLKRNTKNYFVYGEKSSYNQVKKDQSCN